MNPQLRAALPGLLTFGTLVGGCVGTIVYLLFSRFIRRELNLRAMLADFALGAVAFLTGAAAVMFIPMPAQTETRRTGDIVLHITTKRFQHPYWVALALAVLVPIVIEMFRARRRQKIVS